MAFSSPNLPAPVLPVIPAQCFPSRKRLCSGILLATSPMFQARTDPLHILLMLHSSGREQGFGLLVCNDLISPNTLVGVNPFTETN